jgi:hypothetical protein
MRRHLLEAFAKKLSKEDVVVVDATGNASSVAAVIAPPLRSPSGFVYRLPASLIQGAHDGPNRRRPDG